MEGSQRPRGDCHAMSLGRQAGARPCGSSDTIKDFWLPGKTNRQPVKKEIM